MKRALIINQGKSENLGDKAINISLSNILEEKGYYVDSVGFSQMEEQNMLNMGNNWGSGTRSLIKNYTPFWIVWLLKYRKKIKMEFSKLQHNKYDLVVIGGGQLIKTKCVFVYILLTWIRILKSKLDCPILLVGVGADTKYSSIERQIYKTILPKFNGIYVRDKKSQDTFEKQFNINTKLIPDLVFTYNKYYPNLNLECKDIFLVMIYDYNTLKNHFKNKIEREDYYKEWENLIIKNIDNKSKVILAYTSIGDKNESNRFAEYLRENTDIQFQLINTDELDDFVQVLMQTKKVLTGRMHGMILAMNYNCDIIPYVVSPKITSFIEDYVKTNKKIEQYCLEIEKTIDEIIN